MSLMLLVENWPGKLTMSEKLNVLGDLGKRRNRGRIKKGRGR